MSDKYNMSVLTALSGGGDLIELSDHWSLTMSKYYWCNCAFIRSGSTLKVNIVLTQYMSMYLGYGKDCFRTGLGQVCKWGVTGTHILLTDSPGQSQSLSTWAERLDVHPPPPLPPAFRGNNSVRVSVTRSPGPRHLRGNSGASLCPLSCSPWPPKWAWHRQCFCKGRGAYSHLGGYGRQGSTHKDAVNTQGWDEHTRRVWTHVAGVKTRRRCKQTRQVWTYYVHDLGRWSTRSSPVIRYPWGPN